MYKTQVLLVEDEPKVAEPLKRWLEENDFQVDIAPDGAVGRHLAHVKVFDMVLLDLNLPFVSGFDVCKSIRSTQPHLPIIMITALDSIEQKLSGYDAGADDYIVKPFDFRELLARMRLLLKQKGKANSDENQMEILRVADLEINSGFKTVTRAGLPILLTAKEYALLEFLVRRNGRVASRFEIIENVWDVNFDTGTNVVEVYINFLRKKIDKDSAVKLIHTKQGLGYYLKAIDM
jgi:two-component system, OmpR family, copper resistance phosphate regulon response regulator CusR